MYGIEEQEDGTFAVYDKTYSTLTEALRQTVGHHHIEIAQCQINFSEPCQTLFVSKNKWDYVEIDNLSDLKEDIVSQHLWQAERYQTLGQLQNAVAELKKAFQLTSTRKDKLSILLDLAGLLKSLKRYSASVMCYKESLYMTSEHDNRGQIRSLLAEIYERMSQPSKALWHDKRIIFTVTYSNVCDVTTPDSSVPRDGRPRLPFCAAGADRAALCR